MDSGGFNLFQPAFTLGFVLIGDAGTQALHVGGGAGVLAGFGGGGITAFGFFIKGSDLDWQR